MKILILIVIVLLVSSLFLITGTVRLDNFEGESGDFYGIKFCKPLDFEYYTCYRSYYYVFIDQEDLKDE